MASSISNISDSIRTVDSKKDVSLPFTSYSSATLTVNFLLLTSHFLPLTSYLFLLTIYHAVAGGFQINTQGQKAVAMGGCGTAAGADASAVYFNPGSITHLSGKHNFTGGVAFIIPRVSVQTDAVYNTDMTSPVANPIQFYYAAKINKWLFAGFGLNNQFGSTASYPDDWQGKYVIQSLSLKTFMYQPTIAIKIHDKLNIGAGFVYSTGNFSLQKAVPLSSSSYPYGTASLSGKGTSTGFNAGIFSKISHKLNIGISYRSHLRINLPQGEAEFSNIPAYVQYMFPDTTGFSSSLTLPAVFSAGLQYHFSDKLCWALDVNRTFWSSYDSLKFDFRNSETPDATEARMWKNTFTFRTGISYNLSQKFTLRAGCYYDQTPIQGGYVSPELPDNSHAGFTLGGGIKINDKIAADVSWLYSNVKREASLDAKGFEGKYHRIINVIGVGVNVSL